MDTVELSDGWSRNPFGSEIVGKKLYGLGSLNMKGGLAATLVALKTLLKHDWQPRGSVLFTAVMGEEAPFQLGTDPLIRERLISDCDFAIIPEPCGSFAIGELKPFPSIGLSSRGGYMYSVIVKGRSAHGAEPEKALMRLKSVKSSSRTLAEKTCVLTQS